VSDQGVAGILGCEQIGVKRTWEAKGMVCDHIRKDENDGSPREEGPERL